MKNLYEIFDRNDVHLCYQVACTESEAVEGARMYGNRRAYRAEFIRKH